MAVAKWFPRLDVYEGDRILAMGYALLRLCEKCKEQTTTDELILDDWWQKTSRMLRGVGFAPPHREDVRVTWILL